MAVNSAEIKSTLTKSYNAIASRYLVWSSRHSHDRLTQLDNILPHLSSQPNPRVLELGCGAGEPVTLRLSALPNIHVVANDISSAQIAMAKAILPAEKVTLIEADMTTLQFKDEEFHAVIALYSIIHLPKDEQIQMIKTIAYWLKPGGYALINVADGADNGHWEKGWLEEGADMYWSAWSPQEYEKIFQDAGFEVQPGRGEGKCDPQFLWFVAVKSEASNAESVTSVV